MAWVGRGLGAEKIHGMAQGADASPIWMKSTGFGRQILIENWVFKTNSIIDIWSIFIQCLFGYLKKVAFRAARQISQMEVDVGILGRWMEF